MAEFITFTTTGVDLGDWWQENRCVCVVCVCVPIWKCIHEFKSPLNVARQKSAQREDLAEGQIPSFHALRHLSQLRSTSVNQYQEQGHWRLGRDAGLTTHKGIV